jgi:hypothetical protein
MAPSMARGQSDDKTNPNCEQPSKRYRPGDRADPIVSFHGGNRDGT